MPPALNQSPTLSLCRQASFHLHCYEWHVRVLALRASLLQRIIGCFATGGHPACVHHGISQCRARASQVPCLRHSRRTQAALQGAVAPRLRNKALIYPNINLRNWEINNSGGLGMYCMYKMDTIWIQKTSEPELGGGG